MDCRTFRKKHLAFVDDTLPGVDLVEMQRHTLECETCATHDTKIRRALLLFRNIPPIEPSPGFHERLQARLQAEGSIPVASERSARGRRLGTKVAAVASIAAVGYLGVRTIDLPREQGVLTLAPVVATQPVPVPSPTSVASSALIASVSAGTPLWPMVYLAEEAPMHFANAQFTQVSWQR